MLPNLSQVAATILHDDEGAQRGSGGAGGEVNRGNTMFI